MTSTILVWFLVTVGGYNSNNVTYSPPLATVADCQHLQKLTPRPGTSNCIQVRVPVMSLPSIASPTKSSNSK